MLNFYHRCLISEIIINKYMSQTIRDKMYSQQGNSPTQVYKVPNEIISEHKIYII